MMSVFLVALAIILVCAANSAPNRIQPTWSRQMKGWQKVFGIVGFILAMVILLNPELLALGIIGDAAFFDILVLALSIQFQTVAFRAWCYIYEHFSKALEFLFRGMRRDLLMLRFTLTQVGDFAVKIYKAMHSSLGGHQHTIA